MLEHQSAVLNGLPGGISSCVVQVEIGGNADWTWSVGRTSFDQFKPTHIQTYAAAEGVAKVA